MRDLHVLDLVDVAELLRSGYVSALEVVESTLEAISATEPRVSAFVEVFADSARERARILDRLRAEDRGVLHGVPIAVKDVFDIAGSSTRRGSKAFYNARPAIRDALVVKQLRESGAVIVGKTRTHELACGVDTWPTKNPLDTLRSAGGSSGGSGAAVASMMAFGALGTDTGGSVRIPAALCGIVGLKPTFGRLNTSGVAALAWSLDHVGIFGRSVADVWYQFAVIDSPNLERSLPEESMGSFHRLGDRRRIRLGVIDQVFLDNLTPCVHSVWLTVLDRLASVGIDVVRVTLPSIVQSFAAEMTIIGAEASTYYASLLKTGDGIASSAIYAMLQSGRKIPAWKYLAAQRYRTLLMSEVETVMRKQRLDGLLAPTLAATAHLHGQEAIVGVLREEQVADSYVRTTGPFNLLGFPTVSIPAGLGTDGLPVGVQVATAPYSDLFLHYIAQRVEDALGRVQPTWSDSATDLV